MKQRYRLIHWLRRCSVATFLILVGLLGGCKVGSQFKLVDKSAIELAENRSLLLVITYIETGTDSAKNRVFWRHVRHVFTTMEQHDGLVGYAVRRELFGNKGWTISVWQDEESKKKFVDSKPHREAIKNGLPALTKTIFISLPINAKQLPMKWHEIDKIVSDSK